TRTVVFVTYTTLFRSNLLVAKQEEGGSLARALGPHSAVLMRRHGATVVGANVRELVFRSIAMCQNAEYQMRALAHGDRAENQLRSEEHTSELQSPDHI